MRWFQRTQHPPQIWNMLPRQAASSPSGLMVLARTGRSLSLDRTARVNAIEHDDATGPARMNSTANAETPILLSAAFSAQTGVQLYVES